MPDFASPKLTARNDATDEGGITPENMIHYIPDAQLGSTCLICRP